MSKTKPTRDLWHKAQTIGVITGAILKAIELAAPHTQTLDMAMVGLEHYDTWALLLWIIARNIIM